jgi:hypothetical protein
VQQQFTAKSYEIFQTSPPEYFLLMKLIREREKGEGLEGGQTSLWEQIKKKTSDQVSR